MPKSTIDSSKLSVRDIPSQFQIFGHTIKVKKIPDLPDIGKDGDSDIDEGLIRLFTHGQTDSQLWHTFIHEVLHFVFWYAGYSEDWKDETKVDVIAGLLLQILVSSK